MSPGTSCAAHASRPNCYGRKNARNPAFRHSAGQHSQWLSSAYRCGGRTKAPERADKLPPFPAELSLDDLIEECGSGPRVVWSDQPAPITNRWLGDLLKEGPNPSIEVFQAAIDAGYTRQLSGDAKIDPPSDTKTDPLLYA